MFFFKEKTIELIAYTDKPTLAEFFPIKKAISVMPNYYKTMPSKTTKDVLHPIDNTQNYSNNIKSCYGINQFNMNGYVVPLWSDYSVMSTENLSCISPGKNEFSVHDAQQTKGVLDNFYTLKLINPWVLRCNENINF